MVIALWVLMEDIRLNSVRLLIHHLLQMPNAKIIHFRATQMDKDVPL